MHKYLFIILLFFSIPASAQGLKDIFKREAYQHTITSKEDKTVFQLQESSFNPKRIEDFKDYYWYSNNQIKITQGGYSGRLLNGNYKIFYLDRSLKEQGLFENGLKTGMWIKWSQQGKVYERANFKKGLLAGSFFRYNNLGEVLESGNYQDGKMQGVWKSYVKPDSIILTHYKNGLSYTPKVILWKRLLNKKTQPVREKQ